MAPSHHADYVNITYSPVFSPYEASLSSTPSYLIRNNQSLQNVYNLDSNLINTPTGDVYDFKPNNESNRVLNNCKDNSDAQKNSPYYVNIDLPYRNLNSKLKDRYISNENIGPF